MITLMKKVHGTAISKINHLTSSGTDRHQDTKAVQVEGRPGALHRTTLTLNQKTMLYTW